MSACGQIRSYLNFKEITKPEIKLKTPVNGLAHNLATVEQRKINHVLYSWTRKLRREDLRLRKC
jgi:hypothetical protein